MASKHRVDIGDLYEARHEQLLLFLTRRTGDAEVALDLWAETFAQVLASARRYRGNSRDEEAGWLYAIARNQLSAYLRKGYAEQRMVNKLGIERPPIDDALVSVTRNGCCRVPLDRSICR